MSGGVSIAGIGTAGYFRSTDVGTFTLAHQAVERALDDCGVARADIDGLFVHIGSPRGSDFDSLARALALDVGYVGQSWAHGRFTGTVLQQAAMAISAGHVTAALCIGAFRNTVYTNYGTPGFPDFAETLREGGGPHGETPAAGLLAPVGGAAMATTRYLATYGIDREKLGQVAIAQRAWAARNDLAVMRQELSAADYASSPWVVEPIRLHDCSVPIDTAVAAVLTTTERARDLVDTPVRLLGYQGMRSGPREFVFGQPGLGINQPEASPYVPAGADEPVFRSAGVTPADIDALYCYDGISPQVLWTLERFGYCDPGDAADWIADGRTLPGGSFPINTSGGNLSEGHSNGWGHLVEIVSQLRGTASTRQLADCELVQWGTTFGDSIIYGR